MKKLLLLIAFVGSWAFAMDICTSPNSYPTTAPLGPYCKSGCTQDDECIKACTKSFEDTMTIAKLTAQIACTAAQNEYLDGVMSCQKKSIDAVDACYANNPYPSPALTACIDAANAAASSCYTFFNNLRASKRTQATNQFNAAEATAMPAFWSCVEHCCDCEH